MDALSTAYTKPCAWFEDESKRSYIMVRVSDTRLIERIGRWKGSSMFGQYYDRNGKQIAVQFRLEFRLRSRVQTLLGLTL